MTKEEFFAECEELMKGRVLPYELHGRVDRWSKKRIESKYVEGHFFEYDTTGGVSGGSCWGNDYQRGFVNEDYSVDLIDTFVVPIMEKLFPDITFLQFRKVEKYVKERMEEETWEDYEYYGNYNSKKLEAVSFYDVWYGLKEAGIVAE